MFDNTDLIHRSTRAQAIADGGLIDVSNTARQAGFRIPVALTRAVWENYIRVPEGIEAQDKAGRLWDALWMLRLAIKRSGHSDTTFFALHVRNDNGPPRPVTLKAVCGPDDRGQD